MTEPVLREVEEREAEIDAAHKEVSIYLSRARDGLAAAERKLEMSQQQAATIHPNRLNQVEKMRSQAATKLQAQYRGHSLRSAMRGLNIPPPTPAQAQLLQSQATVVALEQALTDQETPVEKRASRLQGAKEAVAIAMSSSAFTDMHGETKVWAELRLPVGADSRALQEAKLRRAANSLCLRVESMLSISGIKTMSDEMAQRIGALEATAQSDMKATAERLRAAFPMLAWQGPCAGIVSEEGPSKLSQSLDAVANFVERAATMHTQSMAFCHSSSMTSEEVAAARAAVAAQTAAAAAAAPRSTEHPTLPAPPAPPKVVDAAVQVGSQVDYQPAVPVLNAPLARAFVKDANCSPHASPREVLRVMLRDTGHLDAAAESVESNEGKQVDILQVAAAKKVGKLWQKKAITSRAALREAGSPEVQMAKMASVCQWEDRIRHFVKASPTTGPQTFESTARSSSAPPIRRLPRDLMPALPPLRDRELELWQEQLVVLKQRLHTGALRATEAERRGRQLAAQLRVALQKAAEAEERCASNDNSTAPPDDVYQLRREVHQLRRLLSLLTPGLHGESLPWSPRLSAAGAPAVVHARAASPSDEPASVTEASDTEAGTEEQNVFRRLHSQESSSEKRWLQRRADLQDEGTRSTEAVMQAFSSVRHTGTVFAQMRSRFDAPHDGPELAMGVVDKLLAEAHIGDPSLPPLRCGAGASAPDLWPGPIPTPWQPVQSLGRSLSRPGSRAGIRSSHFISRPKKTSETAPRLTARAGLQRTYAGNSEGGGGFPKVKLADITTAPALY